MLSLSTQPTTLLLPNILTGQGMAEQNTDSHSVSQREDGIVAQNREREKRKKKHWEGVATLQGNELKVEGGRKRIEIALLPGNIFLKKCLQKRPTRI